ncbi:NUDIX domain-containing protein [Microvirga terricola]|uniref:NUDIX domain-containing protein n=1 Tax=Microvirga terricola TaxID=2719797 RepID=A0ABX0V8V5_9HYPH|nr:NUDIX domain-containing protein [Microvirga terricola]NIX76277.1 NUDIX domain-containing protein [Microvirga terricola]
MRDIAQGVLADAEGRVLLGFRAEHKLSYPHFWDLFGGHVEEGEPIEQALVREFFEELGIVVTRFRRLGLSIEPKPEVNGPKTYHTFVIEAWKGKPENVSGEHTVIEWFTPAKALALETLTDPAREAIETWRALPSGR